MTRSATAPIEPRCGEQTSYSYDRADRITAAGGVSYTVDANGNTTARGSDSFSYDQANRLTSATVGGGTSSYTYDGDGKRFNRIVGGTASRYVYDVGAGLPMLLDDGTHKFVYGMGLAYTVSGTTVQPARTPSAPGPERGDIPRARAGARASDGKQPDLDGLSLSRAGRYYSVYVCSSGTPITWATSVNTMCRQTKSKKPMATAAAAACPHTTRPMSDAGPSSARPTMVDSCS